MFGVESGFDDANSAWCCVVAVRRSNDNESADVICDSARYCCNYFMSGNLRRIMMGVLYGLGCCISLEIMAL